eukprot:12733-Pleurochrysis_carterae.AAC.1
MDVFGPRVMFGVVGQVDGSLIVKVQRGRIARVLAELVEERTEVGGFLRSFGGSDDLSFARGECYCGLFLTAPSNGGLSVHEYMPGR